MVIDHEPKDIIIDHTNSQRVKRINSLKRIELSYDYMINGISDALDDDLIILSDNDEIPNLNSTMFKSTKKKIVIFKQLFFYYKLNLLYDLMPWFGSKACKKKHLKSFSWLRNLKNKRYSFWRLDTYFSKLKSNDLEIIENGGWHFTNVKSPEELFIKMKNFGHHDEFDDSGLTLADLKEKIEKKEVFYDHFADQKKKNKWFYDYKLKKINFDKLPQHVIENKEKYKLWLDL